MWVWKNEKSLKIGLQYNAPAYKSSSVVKFEVKKGQCITSPIQPRRSPVRFYLFQNLKKNTYVSVGLLPEVRWDLQISLPTDGYKIVPKSGFKDWNGAF